MKRYKLVAMTNAVEGKDADFNQWYDNQHLGDVQAIPGFVSAERLVCIDDGAHRYMTIYEIETDNLAGLQAEMGRLQGTDAMPISDALDLSSASAAFWQPVSQS